MSRTELEAYQQTWSSDTPASRFMRFQTENRRAGNAANKSFQTPSVRLLPGTPMMIETYRLKLIERYGVLAMPVLRFHMGTGEMTCQEWKNQLALTEVKMFPHEVNQILAYYTPTNTLQVDRFVAMVAAKIDGFNDTVPMELFIRLFGNAQERTTTADVIARMNADDYPEIVAGFSSFLDGYKGERDGLIGQEEFLTLHRDIYSTTPIADYSALVSGLWSGGGN
jgi:hypothetical protein